MAFREIEDIQLSRRSLLSTGALLGGGLALSTILPGASALARAQAAGWPHVTALADRYVSARKVANVVAAFGRGQGGPEILARGELGFNSGVPADGDSLYRIYSMTKPITGMAAMMLIDDGKLGLNQPIAEILPKFAQMRVQKTYDGAITPDALEPAKRPITIRHLLTHTAGLGYTIIQKGPIKAAYEQAGIIPGQVTRLPVPGIFGGTPAPSLAAFADALAELPLVAQPGTRWIYSVGLDLLGRVIEVASGQAFDTFLKQRLFDPLGMSSTFFRVPASEVGRLTANYGLFQGLVLPLDPAAASVYLDRPAFPFGGAGLVSSPRDYDRFLAMLAGYGAVDGKRVMSEQVVRLGTSNLLPDAVGPVQAGTKIEAFGAGGVVGTGARAGTFGWGGAAGTRAFVDMRSGLRAGLFTQYMPEQTYQLGEEFVTAVMADVAASVS